MAYVHLKVIQGTYKQGGMEKTWKEKYASKYTPNWLKMGL